MEMQIYKSSFLLFAFLLFACNSHQSINIPERNSSTLKRFEDAAEVQKSWSNKNTVIVHVTAEPDNLHPTNGNSSPRSEIFQYTQRNLLYIDFATQQIVPGLVQSMPQISADGLQYKYTLRDDIHWDDGKPLTVDDIIFTAKAFACPLTNDPAVRMYWNNILEIKADNQNSFTIVMKKKHIQNISFLTGFSVMERAFFDPANILSAFTLNQFSDTLSHIDSSASLVSWAKEFNSDQNGRDTSRLNGLGMYKVTEWEGGQYITLTRKKNHWTQKSTDYHEVSYPEKIIFKLNKDEASQMLEFRSQTLDVSSNFPVETFLRLNENDDFKKNYNLAMMPTFNYTYVCFNEKPDERNRRKLFADKNVRRAFAMLTPVDKIIQLIYKQYSAQCRRVVSNVSPLKKDFNSKLEPIALDIHQAVRLLAAAGWTDTDGNGILDKQIDGKKTDMEADLNYLTASPEWKNIALLIMEEMAKAGVRINPVPMDLKLFLEKGKSHDFDLMLGTWSGTCLPEDYTQLWHSSSWSNHGSNYSGFGDSESDALIEKINSEINDSARFSLSHKLQEKIYDDQPYVFLYSNLKRFIIHKRFANQMVFSERPFVLLNMLRLMSINNEITNANVSTP
jgi:ABC-type transport system substrate-binding protein